MSLRKFLTLLTVLFLLAEPMIASVTTTPADPGACVTCGMKATCALVCCCRPHTHSHLETSQSPGLYPMGCHRDRDSAFSGFSNTPRWTPESRPLFSAHSVLILPGSSTTVLLEAAAEVPTPPPITCLLP